MQALYNKQIADGDDIYVQIDEALLNLPTISDECCIFEVPRHVRTANESAYTPLVISIGPLHRHADHLQRNHLHKIKYLKSFGHNQHLQTYRQIVANNLAKIRESYTEPAVRFMDFDELVMMVLIDAAFLIELFRRSHDPRLIEANDPMFYRPRMVVEVGNDVRLEENQLPWFILRELYDAAYGGQVGAPSFIYIACGFLGVSYSRIMQYDVESNCKHFLDLLRANFLPTRLRPRDLQGAHKKTLTMCKTATSLMEAGVKFRVAKDDSSLLDIEFNKGTLMVPRIIVQDDTEALFRNLAVYEQCNYFFDTYINDYILFLDFLINTPADVALLVEHGIIVNWLGSDERAAELFNGLSWQLRLRTDNFYYAEQSEQLNAFTNRWWNRMAVIGRYKYFKHPCAVILASYAVLLSCLIAAQVITRAMLLK